MGVVTGRAFFGFDRIIAVGLPESAPLSVMTVEAELRLGFAQEIFLVGAMGHVACLATLVQQNLMDDLFSKHLFLVALVTGFISRRVKKIAPFRCMGIMAGRAFPTLDRGMHLGLGQPYLVAGMATQTELVPFFFEKQFRDNAVAEMAIFTLLRLDHGMRVFHGPVFVVEFLVTVSTVLAGERPFRPGSSG